MNVFSGCYVNTPLTIESAIKTLTEGSPELGSRLTSGPQSSHIMQRSGPSAWPTGPEPPHPRPSIRRSRPRRRPGNRLMDTRYHTRSIHKQTGSGSAARRAGGLNKTEANVVVPVVGRVPVPVRHTKVVRFVVPGTAPDHTLAVSWPAPLVNTAWEKIARRRPSVSACFA